MTEVAAKFQWRDVDLADAPFASQLLVAGPIEIVHPLQEYLPNDRLPWTADTIQKVQRENRCKLADMLVEGLSNGDQ